MSQLEKALMMRSPPRDEWDVFVNHTIMANEILERYRASNGPLPLFLAQMRHRISWHNGLHTARWVVDNQRLVAEFANAGDHLPIEHERLEMELEASLAILRRR